MNVYPVTFILFLSFCSNSKTKAKELYTIERDNNKNCQLIEVKNLSTQVINRKLKKQGCECNIDKLIIVSYNNNKISYDKNAINISTIKEIEPCCV